MIQTINIRVKPKVAATEMLLREAISSQLQTDINRIRDFKIVKKSIDARQRQVMINLTVTVGVDEPVPATVLVPEFTPYPQVADAPQVVVVGAGPAGLFAALTLIERGLRPVVLERGKTVEERSKDMAKISREHTVDPESNYCFGEGGAGAYSDGKLYTRSKKRGSVEKVLQTFVRHGASENILVDAHPHIGTDRLPQVIRNIRNAIIKAGGEIHFSTKVTDLIVDENDVKGVITADGKTFAGPVILATGHSARDVYNMLHRKGITLEPKGIAVGVRLEHPQSLIDKIQYHSPDGRGKYLPAAEYTMLTRVNDRAVYSFCMCPGGFIVPAATGPDQLVVNGMSPASRGSRWANSGMVVEVLPSDLPGYGFSDTDTPLGMMQFQEAIEKRFFDDAEGSQNAPAQRMTDFVKGRCSTSLPSSSYAAGIHPARVDRLLPPGIAQRLQKGFEEFGRKSRGFLSPEATVIGVETRTSSPVRIPRDPESMQHISLKGLYPVGEGAGYAGGIVSAAIDGIRAAELINP